MQTSFKKSARTVGLLCVIALSGSACAMDKADAPVQSILAARQEAQIQTTYYLSPYLRTTDIKVSVQGDKATLSGKIDEVIGKELAEQIALSTNGIKSVDNQIEVDPKYTYIPPPERSYGEMIKDMGTSATIKSKLLWSKYADGLHAHVDTNRGKVTLTGSAPSQEALAFAVQLAQNTKDVMSVDNLLKIVTPKPEEVGSGESVSETISDTWITTKVKSTFLYSSQVSGHDISVSTKEGVVALAGNLMSQKERSMAIELAQDVRGVTQVNADDLTVN